MLVTGAFGLVGSATVDRLHSLGHRVVASDLDLPVHRKAGARLPEFVEVLWCDLTQPHNVSALLERVRPDVVIHLAAIIPPGCFANPALAHRVNVDSTGYLLTAAEQLPTRPRLIHASSVAVHGSRNPHTCTDLLGPDTPLNPTDLYGAHKAKAETLVRSSTLDWVVLRLGGVMSTTTFPFSPDHLAFESMLPVNNRIQTVDVRDVAAAFAAAVDADVIGEILMIGGDDRTHRITQGDLGPSIAAALGLVNGIPRGRIGDPASTDNWFTTDWMDTERAQQALEFQHHTWPDMLDEIRRGAGMRYYLLRAVAPCARWYLSRKAPYRRWPGKYADVRGAVATRWGRTDLTLHEQASGGDT